MSFLPNPSVAGGALASNGGTAGGKLLPTVTWPAAPLPVTPRDTLNASAKTAIDTQSSIAAENAPIRVIYGQVRLGPQIACVLPYGDGLVILAVWGHGECDSVVSYTIDDKEPATGVTATHYMGATGQTADATLIAAFAANGKTYADVLPGICYSVIYVPTGASSGFPRINAVIKGLKVYDPRQDSTNGGSGTQRFATPSTWAWSDNPALCLADFETNTVYGCKRSVTWSSVASVANDCDVLAGGTEKLRTLNLALETVQPVKNWVETLQTYAGCWVISDGAGVKFVSDKAGSSVATITHAAGQIQSIANIKKRGVQSTPTVMIVSYTDTTVLPYTTKTATVYAAGVQAGTTPRRESQVSLPGINRYSQAAREATERLNKLLLNDLSFNLGVFDEQLVLEAGDIITVSHPIGLTSKQVRVMPITGEYGRYALACLEYDPACFDGSVASAPTYADTLLASPSAPPAVTGVTMVEELFQMENGLWSSRWRVTWTAPAYTFLDYYRTELWIGSTLVQSDSPSGVEWPTGAVQEGANYTAKIAIVSSIGNVGTFGTQSGVALGKQLMPGNVPSISAFEAGGRVYVNWLPAVDIDIWRYEVRYGAVAGSWATATLIDRVDALRLISDQIPVGTWTLHVKALDSVQQYSTTAATVNVTVTSDSNSFLVDSLDQTAPTLTNMAEYSLARSDSNRYFISEDAVAWDTKFSSAINTYTNALATYHSSMTSTWLGESEDFGLSMGGNWTGTATVADVSGTHMSYLGNSTDGSTWNYPAGLSQKVNSRFARMKHEALTTATLLVTIPTQSIRIDAIPKTEAGTVTTSSSGPVTVTLANQYSSVKSLQVTPKGTASLQGVVDNIRIGDGIYTEGDFDVVGFTRTEPNTFDIYLFNSSFAKVVGDVFWILEAV